MPDAPKSLEQGEEWLDWKMKILLRPRSHEATRAGGNAKWGFSWLISVVAQPDRLSGPHDVWMSECGPMGEQSGAVITHG